MVTNGAVRKLGVYCLLKPAFFRQVGWGPESHPNPILGEGQIEVGQEASVCSLGLPQGGKGGCKSPPPEKKIDGEKKNPRGSKGVVVLR